MLFGLDYRQTKVTDSTLQNTLAILKNKRIPLDPRATSSDTLALLINFITKGFSASTDSIRQAKEQSYP